VVIIVSVNVRDFISKQYRSGVPVIDPRSGNTTFINQNTGMSFMSY